MYKEIIDKDNLNKYKLNGMKIIAGVVKRTLGPGGLPIIIQRVGQALDGSPIGPKITKDGVSVAEECSSPTEEEDVIIQAVKAICKKTNSDAGDGTTTAIVLGEAILLETLKVLSEDDTLNPQLIKLEVEAAAKSILLDLEDLATPILDTKSIKQVATISANGDSEIGDVISQAFDHVGAEGVVTVDEGQTNQVTLNLVDGYQFNRGAESRDNFFNNSNKTYFEAEDAAVVLYDGNVDNVSKLLPIINKVFGVNEEGVPSKKIRPIILVANNFTSEVLQFMLIQKMEGKITMCPVKGPHVTHVRTGYYDDLAFYTGGTRLGNGARSLSAIDDDDIGLVNRIVIDKYKTTIYGGQGDESEILKRVDQLKALKEVAESPYDAQVLNDRLAALTGGVAKIGVGGQTEFEIKEKYDRIEDALNAARAAIQEGVVVGGGCTLFRLAEKLDNINIPSVGQLILREALKAPYLQILENVGIKHTAEITKTLIKNKNYVYDAKNKVLIDAFKAGIIDPVKVTKSALENAVSISSLISTAGGAIIYKKSK